MCNNYIGFQTQNRSARILYVGDLLFFEEPVGDLCEVGCYQDKHLDVLAASNVVQPVHEPD